jgi:hypothetical protein
MNLAEIVDEVYGSLGQRFQVMRTEILRYISEAQKSAFAQDCRGFMKESALGAPVEGSAYDYAMPTDCRTVFCLMNPEKTRRVHGYTVDPLTNILHSDVAVDDAVVVYYRMPADLTAETDDALILVPEPWRWKVLVKGAQVMCERSNYSDQSSMEEWNGYLAQWWSAMNAWPVKRAPYAGMGAW